MSTGVKLAHADVTVTDTRTHAPIENLSAADFRVLDNDKEQPVTHFSLVEKDDRPLALVLLVEEWSPSRKLLTSLPEAVSRMFTRLRPEDRVAVIGYGGPDESCQYHLQPGDATPLTHDPAPVIALLARFAAPSTHSNVHCNDVRKHMTKGQRQENNEAFMRMEDDATRAAVKKFEDLPEARPEIIAFAEDVDLEFKSITEPTRAVLLTRDISVNVLERPSKVVSSIKFIISTPSATFQSAVLEYYAHETGGLVLSPPQDQFNQSLEDLLIGIRAKYSLTWRVPQADAPFHSLRIELLGHKNAQLHTRQGYFTTSNSAPLPSAVSPPAAPAARN